MEHQQSQEQATLPGRVATHKLHAAPVPSVYLIEEWCTPAEEEYLIDRVYKEGGRWAQLSGRRLQNWGGTVHEKGMIPQKSKCG